MTDFIIKVAVVSVAIYALYNFVSPKKQCERDYAPLYKELKKKHDERVEGFGGGQNELLTLIALAPRDIESYCERHRW